MGQLTAVFNHLRWTWPLSIVVSFEGYAVSLWQWAGCLPSTKCPMIQTCWPYKGKLSKTLSNLWGIQPQKSEDQSSWLKHFAGALFSMVGMVVGCHTMIIQQSIMAMGLSIGCLWQALRNGTRLRQTSHTHPDQQSGAWTRDAAPNPFILLLPHFFNTLKRTFFVHHLTVVPQKETWKRFVHSNVLFMLLEKNFHSSLKSTVLVQASNMKTNNVQS